MKGLLRKDLPWIVGFAIAGTIALASALCDHSGVRVFVVGGDRLEVAFHVAWIAGLVLGGTAACFDEVLGTRDFLRQRPLSRQRIALGRALGCGIVLGVWFVLAPAGAWLLFAVQGEGWEHTRWVAWSQIGGTFVVLISSCAIGLAAGALPCSWWLRLVGAGAWYLASFGGIHQLSMRSGGFNVLSVFVIGHLAMAALMLGTWWTASSQAADADRAWPARVRAWTCVPLVVALGALWSAVTTEAQTIAVQRLHHAYPDVVRRGQEVLLAIAGAERGLFVVDAAHARTGENLDLVARSLEVLDRDLPWTNLSFGFDAPRWSEAHHRASIPSRYGAILCAGDGHAWRELFDGHRHTLRATGKGPDGRTFAPGTKLDGVGKDVVAWESAARALWRYDDGSGHFVAVAAPADDVVVGLEQHHFEDGDDPVLREQLEPSAAQSPFRSSYAGFVRGQKRAYVVREGLLVAVDGLLEAVERRRANEPWRSSRWQARFSGADPIDVPFTIEAAEGRRAFAHLFTPHTPRERFHAGVAMFWSTMRPQVLQVIAHAKAQDARSSWLFDPLVVDGRRRWLVGAGLLFAAMLTVIVRRRLRALDATPATTWFWTVATLLTGLVGLVASVVCERPRASARRANFEPVPRPRIVSPQHTEEVLA